MSPSSITEEALLEAVADSSRRRVLDLILVHGDITPTALAAELPFTRQAVAKHLAVLDRAARAMAKVAARWDARLDTIKRMAESSSDARRKSARRPSSAP